MYSKTSKEKISSLTRTGAVLLLPAQGTAPKSHLIATCDGCGAQIWIPSEFKNMLEDGNHRTFCVQCLHVRNVA